MTLQIFPDKIMVDTTTTTGNSLVIQGVTDDKITVLVDGKTQKIEKKLNSLQALMQQVATNSVQPLTIFTISAPSQMPILAL